MAFLTLLFYWRREDRGRDDPGVPERDQEPSNLVDGKKITKILYRDVEQKLQKSCSRPIPCKTISKGM